MNALKLTALLMFSVILVSCGGQASSDQAEQTDVTPIETAESSLPPELQRGTDLLNLNDYFMPFSLYVPDSSRGIPNIMETTYGETEIQVGSTFHMVIAEGGDMLLKKEELVGDIMYSHQIIEESSDFILYKSTIADSYLEPEFHFYAVKEIAGIPFEFRDYSNEGGYAETVARFMLTSVNNLVPEDGNSPL